MADVYEDYKNDTDMVQSFTDADGNPVTVGVGETMPILVRKECASEAVISDPPAGMQKVENLYRNPETGRMEIEFIDVPKDQ